MLFMIRLDAGAVDWDTTDVQERMSGDVLSSGLQTFYDEVPDDRKQLLLSPDDVMKLWGQTAECKGFGRSFADHLAEISRIRDFREIFEGLTFTKDDLRNSVHQMRTVHDEEVGSRARTVLRDVGVLLGGSDLLSSRELTRVTGAASSTTQHLSLGRDNNGCGEVMLFAGKPSSGSRYDRELGSQTEGSSTVVEASVPPVLPKNVAHRVEVAVRDLTLLAAGEGSQSIGIGAQVISPIGYAVAGLERAIAQKVISERGGEPSAARKLNKFAADVAQAWMNAVRKCFLAEYPVVG